MAAAHPLITIGENHYSIEYTETDTGAHKNYKLIRSDDDSPIVNPVGLPPHLASQNITVLDSVNSGIGREDRDLYNAVLKPLLAELSIQHEYIKTTDADSISHFAQCLDLAKDNTIIVLGGDTSIYELFNNLDKSYSGDKHSIDVCPIPMGSGNAIALAAGLGSEELAIQNIYTAKSKSPLPFFEIQFPKGAHFVSTGAEVESLTFAIIVSFAMHAKLVHYAEDPKLRGLGVDRFKVAVGQALEEPLQFKFDLSVKRPNGEIEALTKSQAHAYFNIIAAPFIEKGYLISPNSKLAQQSLEYLSFGDIDAADLAPLLMMPYQNGAHVHSPAVDYGSVGEGELIIKINETDKDRSYTCVDGSVIVINNPLGKSITIKNVDISKLPYSFNIVGLV
jgi:diacylglycerol kinase family enzyme